MLLLISAIAGPLLLGLALLAVGLRGRRADDHPLCRRCGYDLTGSISSAGRCPECGADLSRRRAVRAGHRVRRRLPLAAGGLLVVPTLAAIGVGTWGHARGVDPTPYKPSWWLKRELTNVRQRDRALVELTVRLAAGRLSAFDVTAVAERALAAQGGAPGSWSLNRDAFIELAHARGQLDRSRWARYGRQSLNLGLQVVSQPPPRRFGRMVHDATVYPGEDFDITLSNSGGPLVAAQFRVVFDVDHFRLDGEPVASRPTGARNANHYDGRQGWLDVSGPNTGGGLCYWPRRIDAPVSGRLSVGQHTIVATVHVLLYDRADLPDADGRSHPLPDGSKALAGFDVSAAGTVQVARQNHHCGPTRPTDLPWRRRCGMSWCG